MQIVRLESEHNVSDFNCGHHQLNGFLHSHALINQKRGLGTTYVLLDASQLVGYYTLSPAQIERANLPNRLARSLPHYPIPAIRLARLAVDRGHQGKNFGGLLIAHALQKCVELSHELGGHLVLVDCINEDVVKCYGKFGFQTLPDSPLTLFMPMKTAARLNELQPVTS